MDPTGLPCGVEDVGLVRWERRSIGFRSPHLCQQALDEQRWQ